MAHRCSQPTLARLHSSIQAKMFCPHLDMPYQPVKTLYSEKFSCGILVRWQGGYNRGVLSPERWQQINQLFYDALAQPTATRVAFLAEACGADEELRQEVLTLPAADGKAAPLVERPLGAVA